MKAADVMVSNVITVGPKASVREVADILLTNRISAVPVVDQRGNQGRSPIQVVIENRQVEHFGLTEFSAAGRTHVDLLAEFFDVAGGGPIARCGKPALRRADGHERRFDHALALGDLEQRGLQDLHLGEVREFAEPLLGNAGRLGAERERLRRPPVARGNQ